MGKQSIILGFVLICLFGCGSSRKATEQLKQKFADSSKYYRETIEAEKLYSHNLERRIAQEDLSGIQFRDKPCPEVKTEGNPCPEKPVNTVDISSDGSIHASGDIAAVNLSRKKITELQEQLAKAQKVSKATEKTEYYITKTVEHWHTTTVKVRPGWFWKLLYIAIGAAGMWAFQHYKSRLRLLFPLIKR